MRRELQDHAFAAVNGSFGERLVGDGQWREVWFTFPDGTRSGRSRIGPGDRDVTGTDWKAWTLPFSS